MSNIFFHLLLCYSLTESGWVGDSVCPPVTWSCDSGKVSEVVGHPADRLDVGVLRLPLHVGAVVPSLHDVHAAAVVGLFVQHPAVWNKKTRAIFSVNSVKSRQRVFYKYIYSKAWHWFLSYFWQDSIKLKVYSQGRSLVHWWDMVKYYFALTSEYLLDIH